MVQESIEQDAVGDSSRRASGRARKPTAKAQALSEFRTFRGDSASTSPMDGLAHYLSPSISPDADELTVSSKRKSRTSSAEITAMPAISTPPPTQTIARPSEEKQTNPDEFPKPMVEDTSTRSSKRERKPTARALEADQPELEELLTPRKRSASPAKDRTANNVPRKRVGRPPKNPSRLRHSTSVQDHGSEATPAAPQTPNPETTESPKSDRARHHHGFPKAKEREVITPAAPEVAPLADTSLTPESSKPDHPKHRRKQGKARAGEAAGVSHQPVALDSPNKDRAKQANSFTKRKKRGAAARASIQTSEDVFENQTPGFMRVTQTGSKSVANTIPKGQKRLILTVPLPSSSNSNSPTFPARARKAEFLDKGCQLFCLDAASRILAFAEIAADSPDSDEEDDGAGDPSSGLYEKWLEVGRKRFCVCGKPESVRVPSMLTEDELTQILEPNEPVQSPGTDRASETSNASSAISFPPVNSIVKASEGRRVSTFYSVIAGSAPPWPATNLRQATMGPPVRPAFPRPPQRANTISHSPYPNNISKPLKILGGGAYEDRMREDFRALEQVRQEALACGISVRYDMSHDQLKALIEQKKQKQKSSGARVPCDQSHRMNGVGDVTPKPAAQTSSSKARSLPLELFKLKTASTKDDKVDFHKPESQSPDPLTEPKAKSSTPRKRKTAPEEQSLGSDKRARTSKKSITAARRPSEVMVID